MFNPYIILIPLLATLVGWGTNYLAVRMLFRPRKKIRIAGIEIQGVFPKRQMQLAKKIGELVAQELLSASDLSTKLKEFSENQEIQKSMGQRIEKAIRQKLVKAFPMLAMFLTDEMVEKVTSLFKEELNDFMEDQLEELTLRFEQNFDVGKIVQEKVEAFSIDKLEKLLMSLMKKEFFFIELIGAVIGFVIGCLQVLINLLATP